MPSGFSVTVLTDCGSGIGLGHVRRSLVIASALKEHGGNCVVLTPSNDGEAIAKSAGMPAAAWPDDLVAISSADILIADSYRFPPGIQKKWRESFRVIVLLDDNKDSEIDADIVINGNLYGDAGAYASWYQGIVLAGPVYAPIDPAFFTVRNARKTSPRKILVSLGGTDDGTLSAPLVSAVLQSITDCAVDLVISPLHERAALPDGLRQNPRLNILRGGDMPGLMGAASLFIGGAGISMIEAAAADIPVIAIQIAGNQAPNIEILKRHAVPVFDLQSDPKEIAGAANALLKSGKGNPLVGSVTPGGADRIAAAILRKLREH